MRILYVEDDARIRETISAVLKCNGHLVHDEADCSAAVAIIKEAPSSFDVLISDIETPGGINGWELAEVARACAPAIPVIYSTGASLDNARPVANGHILRKPFTPAALLRHLEEARAPTKPARHIVLPLARDESALCLSHDRLGTIPQAPSYAHAAVLHAPGEFAQMPIAA